MSDGAGSYLDSAFERKILELYIFVIDCIFSWPCSRQISLSSMPYYPFGSLGFNPTDITTYVEFLYS